VGYKPSTNAGVEQFHRTLNALVGRVISACLRNWDGHVAVVLSAYRSMVHSETGVSILFDVPVEYIMRARTVHCSRASYIKRSGRLLPETNISAVRIDEWKQSSEKISDELNQRAKSGAADEQMNSHSGTALNRGCLG